MLDWAKYRKITIDKTKRKGGYGSRIDIDKDFLKEVYLKEKKSASEIAEKLGVNVKTILRRLKDYGMPVNTKRCFWEKGRNTWNKGLKGWNKGHITTEETKRKISEAQKGKPRPHCRGENNPNWKGGITPQQVLERNRIKVSVEYRLWRESVYARDNWTCQKCEKRGGIILNPHHIRGFVEYPKLRVAIDNGITLCDKCHRKFHKIYGRKKNNEKQIKEFISLC